MRDPEVAKLESYSEELETMKALAAHLEPQVEELDSRWQAALAEYEALPPEQKTPERLKTLSEACIAYGKACIAYGEASTAYGKSLTELGMRMLLTKSLRDMAR